MASELTFFLQIDNFSETATLSCLNEENPLSETDYVVDRRNVLLATQQRKLAETNAFRLFQQFVAYSRA